MKNSLYKKLFSLSCLLFVLTAAHFVHADDEKSAEKGSDKIKVFLVDGQNNHDWKRCSPVMIDTLEAT